MRLVLAIALTACAGDATGLVDDGSLLRIPDGTPEAAGVLGLLNDAGTTLQLLDQDVGLDRRAATSLIEHRDGPDGRFGTADDDLFDDIAEVDAQYYVGDAALGLLLDYATSDGWVTGPDAEVGRFEGVPFTAQQVEQVLALVNHAALETLDDDVGLDRRAATGIVAQRPFADIETLATVPYVGPTALRALRDHAADSPVDPGAQIGEDCATTPDCAEGLMCAGALIWGEGVGCVDTWGVFSHDQSHAIPDDGTPLQTSVDVQGLASVPVDVVLTIDIDHPRPSDLVLSIDNFLGYGTTLWTGGDDNPSLEMVVRAFPSDDAVHGTYTVHLTDTVPGQQGTLSGWDLLVVSVYD